MTASVNARMRRNNGSDSHRALEILFVVAISDWRWSLGEYQTSRFITDLVGPLYQNRPRLRPLYIAVIERTAVSTSGWQTDTANHILTSLTQPYPALHQTLMTTTALAC